MLGGAIIGSGLGTFSKFLYTNNNDDINKVINQNLNFMIPSFLLNLVLAFIIGVVLMRKKDVQPFLTVEDFWEDYY
jgi:hypothetical protein